MQAISVKFIPATDCKGSRYKAEAAAGSATVGTDYALNADGNARSAAMVLVKKLGWNESTYGGPEDWKGGQLKDGRYVFVNARWSD